MTSTVIIRTDSKLKQKAQKTAEDLGLTLTSVMNGFLADFVDKKSILFTQKSKTNMESVYGSIPGKFISMKQIKEPVFNWQKRISEIG